ncbi:MAG: hypothetical protein ABIA62_03655 [Candidatus Woesearchaeota archaeon]
MSLHDNLTRLLLPGVKNSKEKTDQVIEVVKRVAETNNTTAVSVLRNLLQLSTSKDVFDAVSEWNPIGYYEAPKSDAGRRKAEVRGTLYGAALCDAYTLQNTHDPSRIIHVGDTLYRRLVSDFRDFGKPEEQKLLSDEVVEKKKKEKQKQLDNVLKKPRDTLDEVLNEPKNRRELEKIDAIGLLDDEIRRRIAMLDKISQAQPEMGDSRDHAGVIDDYTEHLVSLEKNRGFMSWFGDELRAGTLPEQIAGMYLKARDDILDMAQWESTALFIYAAKNRRVMRRAVVGSIEDDLKLLESLPSDHPLIKKYGAIDLTPISDLLGKKAITLIDATRILDVRPDIIDIRQETNAEVERSYKEDIYSILDKVRPIFMTDRFLWHEEFKDGRSEERTSRTLYAKTFNNRDYTQIKKVLARATIGVGDVVQNLRTGYSIGEFSQTIEDLVVLGRRMKLVENIARAQELPVGDVYDVDQKTLDRIDVAQMSKVSVRDKKGNLKYHPAEHFVSHPKNSSGLDLAEMVAMFDVAKVGSLGNFHYHQFKETHFPRIRMLADVGLFHEDDVERLEQYFRTVKSKVVSGSSEEIGIFRNAIERARDNPLMEFIGELPAKGLKMYTSAQVKVLEAASKACEAFYSMMDDVGGLEEHKKRLAFLEYIKTDCTVYIGRQLTRGCEIHRAKIENDSLVQKSFDLPGARFSFGGGLPVKYLSPHKVLTAVEKFNEEHKTLADICSADPLFLDRLHDLAGADDFMRKKLIENGSAFYGSTGVYLKQEAMAALREIAGEGAHDKVYLSNDLAEVVNGMHSEFQKYQEAKKVAVEAARAVQVAQEDDAVSSPMTVETPSESAKEPMYTVLVPKGYGKSATYQHRYYLARHLGMTWTSVGYKKLDVTESELADMRERIQKLNEDKGSRLTVRAVKRRDQ